MVRQLTAPRSRSWKATLAAFLAAGLVASHIMACIESPMSFSPTGDLAFTVADPFPGNEDPFLMTGRAYRLMILSKDRELREVERSYTHLLTAPGYSPDGTHIAYFRLPLLTAEDEERIGKLLEDYEEQRDQGTAGGAEQKWIYIAPDGSVADPPPGGFQGWENLTLPRQEEAERQLATGAGVIPAELVIRVASTGEVVQTVPLGIPLVDSDDDEHPYLVSYVYSRPQYSPDGEWIYALVGSGFLIAVHPATGNKRLYSLVPNIPLLPTDGHTLALARADLLGFLDSDGKRAVYVRPHGELSPLGIAWIDSERLLVLESDDSSLVTYNIDGHPLSSQSLTGVGNHVGWLAIAPDGNHMVMSSGADVHFLGTDGQLLGSWEVGDPDQTTAYPVFSPDSRQVAFKLIVEEETEETKWHGTTAIVFFSPEGQELFRVPIPRIPPEDRPAPPAPADEPSAEPAPAIEETQQ